jgi:hypothetical protein
VKDLRATLLVSLLGRANDEKTGMLMSQLFVHGA